MKIAYYTSIFNSEHSDKTHLFCIWLYYLLKSESFVTESDSIFVISDEKTKNDITSSNLYKFTIRLKGAENAIQFINMQALNSNIEMSFVKFFPPVLDIMNMSKFDYIMYCDLTNIINGNIRSNFKNSEEIPTAYVVLEKSITDDNYFSYIKDTEWYSKNKEVVDKLPAINSSLFCIKNGVNEITLLKSIFHNAANETHNADSYFNHVLYSHSQYLSEQCYIELLPELFFNAIEINKIDSKKDIIMLKDIDMELMNETLLLSLICRLEKL